MRTNKPTTIAFTQADVVAYAVSRFPHTNTATLLALLDEYGVESYQQEPERVKMAVLYLSQSDEHLLLKYLQLQEMLMLYYKDFLPEPVQESWLSEKWPTLDVLLDAANQWLKMEPVEVVNIETIIVPTLAGGVATTKLSTDTWEFGAVQQVPAYQFIRVWYRK